jgi:hypothetical protein
MNLMFQVRLTVAIRKVRCVGYPAAHIRQESAGLDVEVDKGSISTCINTRVNDRWKKAFWFELDAGNCLLYLLTSDGRAPSLSN